jgi:hypothetical protein
MLLTAGIDVFLPLNYKRFLPFGKINLTISINLPNVELMQEMHHSE